MLTPETTFRALQWPDGHRIHRFWESSTPVFRAHAIKIIDKPEEGFVRMWISEKGGYGYKYRTAIGELLDDKPDGLSTSDR